MADFQRLQYEFAAHLRDPVRNPAPAGIEDRRLAVYRELFFNNIRGFLRKSFPVLARTLGDDRFERLARDWFAEHRARTPLFPRMPLEFVDYLADEREAQDGDPPWLAELAHYEWVEIALTLDSAQAGGTGGDPVEGVPSLSPLAWPLAYAYPVHRIGPDFQPDAPGPAPTLLVVHRDRDDRIGFLAVNPVTWRLLELMQDNRQESGGSLIRRVAAELGHDEPDTLLEAGREALEQLLARGIITTSGGTR